MPRLSVWPDTIVLSSDFSVATVDTFITNIFSMSAKGKSVSLPAHAGAGSMTGWSKNSESFPLGKSVLLSARAVTDSVTGRSKDPECSPLGEYVSLPACFWDPELSLLSLHEGISSSASVLGCNAGSNWGDSSSVWNSSSLVLHFDSCTSGAYLTLSSYLLRRFFRVGGVYVVMDPDAGGFYLCFICQKVCWYHWKGLYL